MIDWPRVLYLARVHIHVTVRYALRILVPYGPMDRVASLVAYLLTVPLFDLLRTLALIVVVGRLLVPIEDCVLKRGAFGALGAALSTALAYLAASLAGLPGVRTLVRHKVDRELAKVEDQIVQRGPEFPEHHEIPAKGFSPREIQAVVKQLGGMRQSHWETGRLSGAVYHGGRSLRELQTNIFGVYTFANQLHPDCFPAVRRMDAEVVSMVLDLYHGPKGAVGTTTSGGTESLLLTCLAARELGKQRGLTEFEIVAPVTVHAGIDKAAYYFGMKLVHAPLDPRTMQVDVRAVKSLIGPNTVLLVGSAPNYPHGVIDDIVSLGALAQANELPLHVDACLGSFIVPFLEEVGGQTLAPVEVPLFDFRVPGVTSISCDTHKYGFAPKGSSVIMYRSNTLRRKQYFVSTDWSGGLYASPTLAGSRPGALVAGCWATLMYMGKDGYRKAAQSIIATTRALRQGLQQRPDLFFVYGDPQASVVAFGCCSINVYDLGDAMSKKGWHLATLQNPPALHMASTELTRQAVPDLLRDLVETAAELAKQGSKASSGSTKALYGVAGSVSTSGIAEQLAEGFIDCLYKA